MAIIIVLIAKFYWPLVQSFTKERKHPDVIEMLSGYDVIFISTKI